MGVIYGANKFVIIYVCELVGIFDAVNFSII